MRYVFLIFFLFVFISSSRAQEVIIQKCPQGTKISSANLKNALIDSLKDKQNIEFYQNSSACIKTEATKRNFSRLINSKYFNQSTAHFYSEILNNKNYFSVELFVFKNESIPKKIQQLLGEKGSLRTPSPTSYQLNRFGGNLLIFVYARSAYTKENQELIHFIKENFAKNHQ
jgi:hypothetical protein